MTREIVIRIQVPDGVPTPIIDYQNEPPHPAATTHAHAPSTGDPTCPQHGPMEFKKGTSKAGNPYAGYFCGAEGCNTAPVWVKSR